eukprot:gene9845-10691_t
MCRNESFVVEKGVTVCSALIVPHLPHFSNQARPSCTPTTAPTRLPTSQPSTLPTSTPSSFPTTRPSNNPSSQPTSRPKSQPSQCPTNKPRSEPSSRPSSHPSQSPSSLPYSKPSNIPSSQPTSHPSYLPSSLPSTPPSQRPSLVPSTRPTSHPTSIPYTYPSSKPSSSPNSHPSSLPTIRPSSHPTSNPTAQPSQCPTNKRSEPSSRPSSHPSQSPSSQPSSLPYSKPSNIPSSLPSTPPSQRPSLVPSTRPTSHPTSIPYTYPSSKPSSSPNSHPSSLPTIRPSSHPTSNPTAQPSNLPSFFTTLLPSPTLLASQPSVTPTSTPSSRSSFKSSNKPTSLPSSSPTTRPSFQSNSLPSSFPLRPTTDTTVTHSLAVLPSTTSNTSSSSSSSVATSFVSKYLNFSSGDQGSVDSLLQVTSLGSYLLHRANCSLTPNCTSLHRLPCYATPHTCGPCMTSSMIGTSGDANDRCYNPGHLSVSSNDVVGSSLKQCVGGCSGHGQCVFLSTLTNEEVSGECYEGDVTCTASCVCDVGYRSSASGKCAEEVEGGADDLIARQTALKQVSEGVVAYVSMQETSEQTVTSWLGSVSEVVGGGSGSDDVSSDTLTTLLDVVSYAMTSASSLSDVTGSLSGTSGDANDRCYNPGDLSVSPYEVGSSLKQCVGGCSGHGQCVFLSTFTNEEVSGACYDGDVACTASCVCDSGYRSSASGKCAEEEQVGADDLLARQTALKQVSEGVVAYVNMQETSEQTVTSWLGSVSEVVGGGSGSDDVSSDTLTTLLDLVSYAMTSASTLSDVTGSLSSLPDTLDKVASSSRSRRRLVGESNSTDIVLGQGIGETVRNYTVLVGKDMTPGQAATTLVRRNFRLHVESIDLMSHPTTSTTVACTSSSWNNLSVSLPLSALEALYHTPPTSSLTIPLPPPPCNISSTSVTTSLVISVTSVSRDLYSNASFLSDVTSLHLSQHPCSSESVECEVVVVLQTTNTTRHTIIPQSNNVTYITEESCLQPSSVFRTGEHQCLWQVQGQGQGTGGDCVSSFSTSISLPRLVPVVPAGEEEHKDDDIKRKSMNRKASHDEEKIRISLKAHEEFEEMKSTLLRYREKTLNTTDLEEFNRLWGLTEEGQFRVVHLDDGLGVGVGKTHSIERIIEREIVELHYSLEKELPHFQGGGDGMEEGGQARKKEGVLKRMRSRLKPRYHQINVISTAPSQQRLSQNTSANYDGLKEVVSKNEMMEEGDVVLGLTIAEHIIHVTRRQSVQQGIHVMRRLQDMSQGERQRPTPLQEIEQENESDDRILSESEIGSIQDILQLLLQQNEQDNLDDYHGYENNSFALTSYHLNDQINHGLVVKEATTEVWKDESLQEYEFHSNNWFHRLLFELKLLRNFFNSYPSGLEPNTDITIAIGSSASALEELTTHGIVTPTIGVDDIKSESIFLYL